MAVSDTKQTGKVNLNQNLVFTRFSDLVKKRENLYKDYIEIDEKDEISNAWVNFSGQVVQDLLDVINLTKSLFDRLVDGIRRSSDQPDPNEIEKIKNLTEFWLDLSILSYLYATIERRGVLGFDGKLKNSLGYVETKKSLDDLTILAFQAQEFFPINSRIVLGEILSLDQEKKRLDFLTGLDDTDDMRYQILGEYDLNQTNFLLGRVRNRILLSAKDFWWLDPVALHSASEHAIEHLNSMNKHWANCTSDLIEKGNGFYMMTYPIAKSFSDVALAQHYKRLAIAALKTRGVSVASEYFANAEKLTKSFQLDEINATESKEIWGMTIGDQNLLYQQMTTLSLISSKYDSIVKRIKNRKKESAILIDEILDNLTQILSKGDLAYVSSVAIVYETIFSYMKEQIDKDTDITKILTFVENRINSVAIRLDKASHQITTKWTKLLQKSPYDVTALKELVNDIELPLMALLILPPDTQIVSNASSELMAVQVATEALYIGRLADEEFGKNPVKEMLMRAKVYELTGQSMSLLNEISDKDTRNQIVSVLTPLRIATLLRGLIAEVQLRTAVLQYRFINRIAPLIENSSLAKKENPVPYEIDEGELNSFSSDLENLNIAAITLEENKMAISIGGSPLNWQYIKKIRVFSDGLKSVIKSVNLAIKASSLSDKEVEDAIEAWDKAKTIAFKAADTVSKAGTDDSENLGQQIFTLAQIYTGYENAKRNRTKIEDFPIQGIVELIQALVMGM